MRFLVLTGLSGAGKTTARGFLEDLGYFMVDNLPPRLWPPLLQEAAARGLARVGVVVDARALAFFQDLEEVLEALRPWSTWRPGPRSSSAATTSPAGSTPWGRGT